MKQYVDRWQARTDRFSLLLSFFFVVLLVLFFYLSKIDRDIEHYNTYRHELGQVRILNDRLDIFFHRAYRFIDYDAIEETEKNFETHLDVLDVRNVENEFGTDAGKLLHTIKREYEQKKMLLEDFKTLNARVTNSIHYLFDLRKTLEQKLLLSTDIKVLVDDIFFSITQLLMDMPFDKTHLTKQLDRLEKCCSEESLLTYFLQHSRQLLCDSERMSVIKTNIDQIPLASSLEHLLGMLYKDYRQHRKEQKMIAVSLILFSIVILSLLIYSYRRVRRNTRELEAFRFAIEKSDNAMVITNPQREIVYVNEAFEKKSGYSKDEVVGRNPNFMKSGQMSDAFYAELNATLERGDIWQGEIINRRKDGTLLYEKVSILPVSIEGELVQYLAVKLDITEYKEQQLRLKQAAAVYRTMGDGVLITDSNKHILSVNPAFERMFGYTQEELLGKEPMVVQTLKEDDYFYRQMWDRLLKEERWSGKLHNKTKDGTVLPIWLTLTIVRDNKGEIKNFIAIYTNLEEIIATQERAEYLAYHDSLTGLPNRAYFDLRIIDILQNAKENQKQVALFFMDLDRFKFINDTLGHTVGDKMLIELAKRIGLILNENVLFARIGGDEFVVAMTLREGKKEAEKTAQQLLANIREPIKVHNYHLNTTASIGIALFPDDAKEKYGIVKYADSAMYAAKEKGKDRYEFYSKELSVAVAKRLEMEQELSHALERHEFTVHYQPQYALEKRQIVGVEALVRWHNRTMGNVPPDTFISIAEETGIIVKIGYFIFEEACRAFVRWKEAGYHIDTVAINISSIQFQDEGFIEEIRRIIEHTNISPSSIEIEITERFIMEYSTSNLTILDDLRTLGCKISIDDFGTGYSSMSYLKQLPLDTLKIDRSFIGELPDNKHDAVVTQAIIALSKSLGYKVVAEGIEYEAQEQFLKAEGCDIGQGYFFSKPLDETSLTAFFETKGAKTER